MHVDLPIEIREFLTQIPTNTGIVWHRDKMHMPSIAMKLPEDLDFFSMVFHVQPLKKVTGSYKFEIRCDRKHSSIVSYDCFINPAPIYDPQLLQILSSVKQIELYAVTPSLTFIGTQILSWSSKRRRQIKSILQNSLDIGNVADQPFQKTVRKEQKGIKQLPDLSAQSGIQAHFLTPQNISQMSSTPLKKPVIVEHPLLIDRYIQRNQEKKFDAINQSDKYIWMHSAWLMVEVLCDVDDGIPFHSPPKSIYIELEQPRWLHEQQVAAFSFLQEQLQRWQLSLVDNEGRTVWSVLYEDDIWALPRNYHCPEEHCTIEEIDGMRSYILCEQCQKRIRHYTSWMRVALRMIAGDFQEDVELKEPETVLEVGMEQEEDQKTGNMQKRSVLRKFRVIRYYDACGYKERKAQTKRGSWMSGRPLADSEYEVNLDAIIYVQKSSRDHDRTYRDERYTNMRGKTQHIGSHARLQPMTIARFRGLPQMQRITRVHASKYE